jgi:hypothetical protein
MRIHMLPLAVAFSSACLGACSTVATGPSALAGHTVEIVDVRRLSDRAQAVRVTARFSLGSRLDEPQVWVCLGRQPEVVIVGSCRGQAVAGASGEVALESGVQWAEGQPVVAETHYVFAFVTSGPLYADSLHEALEERISALTRRIAARLSRSMTWAWSATR